MEWYEVFIDEGEELGTHTIQSFNTYEEAKKFYYNLYLENPLNKYGIDLWTGDGIDKVEWLKDCTPLFNSKRYYLIKIDNQDLLGNLFYTLLSIPNNITDEKLEAIFDDIIQNYPDNADIETPEEIPESDYRILKKYLPEYTKEE